MSVCDSFTEHAWIKGKCQDCFRPLDQHRGGPANQAAGGGYAAPANAEKTRPPVAKKPASFRAPAVPAQVGNGDGEVGRDARQAEGGRGAHAVMGWRKGAVDGALDRKRSNNNNNQFGVRHARLECKEVAGLAAAAGVVAVADLGSACDKLENGNNNDNDVFVDAAVLANQHLAVGDAAGGCDNSSLALFLNRIRSRYHRSAERGAAAAHGCLASDRKVWRPRKRVRLGEGGPEVISHEGGLFCYADSEASSGSPEEAAGMGGVAAAREEGRESWDESDEELLAIEMRMRDRSRFAELRPNSLSPVHFGRHGGRTVRPRNPVLRRNRPHERDDCLEAERDAASGADAKLGSSEGKASYMSSSEDLETPSPVSAGALCSRQELTLQGLDSQGNTSVSSDDGNVADAEAELCDASERSDTEDAAECRRRQGLRKSTPSETDSENATAEPGCAVPVGDKRMFETRVSMSLKANERNVKPCRVVNLHPAPAACDSGPGPDEVSAKPQQAVPMEEREQPHRPQRQQHHVELRCGAQLEVGATKSAAAAQEPLTMGEKRLNHAANLLFTLSAVPHTPMYAQSTRSKILIPSSAAHEENNNYVIPAPPPSESQASRPQRMDSPGERPGREHAQPHGRFGGGGNASPAIFVPNVASPRIGGSAVKTTTAVTPSGLFQGSPPKHKTFLYVEGAGGDPRKTYRGSVTVSERIERSEEGLLNANAALHHAEDRGDASAALSQLVASIKPPNLPPELPKKRFKGRIAGDEAKLEVSPPPQYCDQKGDVSSDGRVAGSDERHASQEATLVGTSPSGFVDPDTADDKLQPPLLRQGVVVAPGPSAGGRPPATPPRISPKSRRQADGGADAPPRPPPRTRSSSGLCPEPPPLLPKSSTSRTPSPGLTTETGDIPGAPAPSPRQRQSVQRKSSHWEVVRNLFPWKKQQDGRPKSGDRRNGAAPPCENERPDPEQPSGGIVIELDTGERPAAALLYKQDYPRFINPALGNGSGAAQNSSRSPKSKKSSGSVSEEPEPRPRKRSVGAERGEKKTLALGVARQTAAKRPPAQAGVPIPANESSVDPEDVHMDKKSVVIAPSQPAMGNHARGDRPARRETPATTETETAPESQDVLPTPSREASPRSPAPRPPGGPLAAVYGNVGRLRAGMAPEKHPRPLREASEDAIAFEGPADADGRADTPESAPPPPLPAKRSGSRAGSSASASPSGFEAGSDAAAPHDRHKTKGEEGGGQEVARAQQQQQQPGLSHTDPLGRRVPRKDRGGGTHQGPQQQLFKSHSVECSPVHAAFSGDATPERRVSPASRGRRLPHSLKSTSQDSIPESDDSLTDSDGSPFPVPALDAAYAGRGAWQQHRQQPGSKSGTADGRGEAVTPVGGVYRNIESSEAVSARILSLQAEATRRLAAKCEEVFMRGCAARVGLREESWPDFKLRSNKPCCEAGDGTYYAATYAKDPNHAYAIKVCKGRADASQRRRQQQSATVMRGVPVHYNIQQECGHFVAEVPPSLLPHGENVDGADPGRLVVITREAPHRTLADLVKTSAEEHRAEPERYERLASLLLLQLCAALEHLKMHGVTHCGLRLENLLLAHSGRPGDPTPRLVLSNFLQAKQQQQPKNRAHQDRGKTGASPLGGPTPPEQLRLAPELLSAAQYRKLDEFQTGILIYEMLHLPNPFEDDPGLRASGYSTDDLPPFLRLSCYSSGLQRLAFQLLQPDPASRLPIAEARVALQLLAWGPQAEHLTRELGGPQPDGRRLQEVLRNWLDVRRALLMVVFAEKALAQDGAEGGGVNLEDWLRCQFFAFTTVNCMARAVELLRLC